MIEKIISITLFIIYTAVYAYQFYYLVISLLHKPKRFRSDEKRRYAVAICARNEEIVIPQLLDALHVQSYPSDLLDVFVCADNCSDATADIAEAHGAHVYRRSDFDRLGKGAALTYLFSQIDEDYGLRAYDGYFIFDADNIPASDFVERMNDVFCSGYDVVTGYRAPLNFNDTWISASQSLYFLRECRFLNAARMNLGLSSTVSGTGYLISSKLLDDFGGWRWHLLCEDLEFSAACACNGIRIGYCDEAVFYDEQPLTLAQSIRQRTRWIKGGLQVFAKYWPSLLSRFFSTGDFSGWDIFASLCPVLMLMPISIALDPLSSVAAFAAPMMLYAALLLITERKRLRSPKYRRPFYIILFPVFMMLALPISYAAVFMRVEWKPIAHGVARARKKSLR